MGCSMIAVVVVVVASVSAVGSARTVSIPTLRRDLQAVVVVVVVVASFLLFHQNPILLREAEAEQEVMVATAMGYLLFRPIS